MSGGFEQRYQDEATADALDRAAVALYVALGGTTSAWQAMSQLEKDAWRKYALTKMNAYHQEDA